MKTQLLSAIIITLCAANAHAYKVYTVPNSSSSMAPNTGVTATNVTEFALKAEAHQYAKSPINAVTAYARTWPLQVLPDVGKPQGETITVKFVLDHKSNYGSNRGCTTLFDMSTNPHTKVFELCGVQHVEKEVSIVVGRSYRSETNAQAKFIDVNTTSSYVSTLMWQLPSETSRYIYTVEPTKSIEPTKACSVDDNNNGHGNDQGKVDPSNPGNSKK